MEYTANDDPYGDSYHAEMSRLYEARNRAAHEYTSQMLYMREGLFSRDDKLRAELAEEAAQEWLRLDAEMGRRLRRGHRSWAVRSAATTQRA